MATLHFIFGKLSSERAEYALNLEKETSAFRLSPDEWISEAGLNPNDFYVRSQIEEVQWGMGLRLLKTGESVILDFGFKTPSEIETFRLEALRLQVLFQFHDPCSTLNDSVFYRERLIGRSDWKHWFKAPFLDDVVTS